MYLVDIVQLFILNYVKGTCGAVLFLIELPTIISLSS